jgi:D-3-phosphoglycerate dehydrogenase
MKVIASDSFIEKVDVKVEFFDGQSITTTIKTQSLESLFKEADFITLHVPAQDGYIIGEAELETMKPGVGIVNCARGGVIDEVALVKALDSGKVLFAGLDVFENEPNPEITILMNQKISLTPHIGAATLEAQDRIGTELASQIISILKN